MPLSLSEHHAGLAMQVLLGSRVVICHREHGQCLSLLILTHFWLPCSAPLGLGLHANLQSAYAYDMHAAVSMPNEPITSKSCRCLQQLLQTGEALL